MDLSPKLERALYQAARALAGSIEGKELKVIYLKEREPTLDAHKTENTQEMGRLLFDVFLVA